MIPPFQSRSETGRLPGTVRLCPSLCKRQANAEHRPLGAVALMRQAIKRWLRPFVPAPSGTCAGDDALQTLIGESMVHSLWRNAAALTLLAALVMAVPA